MNWAPSTLPNIGKLIQKKKILMDEVGFTQVTIHDIFPDTLNVWEDTRHFMFVCKKK